MPNKLGTPYIQLKLKQGNEFIGDEVLLLETGKATGPSRVLNNFVEAEFIRVQSLVDYGYSLNPLRDSAELIAKSIKAEIVEDYSESTITTPTNKQITEY